MSSRSSDSRRVVVTGMGAVSSIGLGLAETEASLRAGRSGIGPAPDWEERGLASQVCGWPVEPRPDSRLATRTIAKSSSGSSLMALWATCEAIDSAGLRDEDLRGSDTPVIIGAGTGSMMEAVRAARALDRHHTTRRVSAFSIPRSMTSGPAANVSVALGTRGESWGVSSACASGNHAIGIVTRLLRAGAYERAITGGADSVNWLKASGFDAMHALSRGFNDEPERASRPFDAHRDGFVISGGAGILILETLEAARRRGAPIVAEILGFATCSDGLSMVQPWPEGAARVMSRAIEDAGIEPASVDYVNAHGTSTPPGDPSEGEAVRMVFGDRQPWISSTKSTTGHPIGPAGSLEAIYSVLMMRGGFVAPSVNVDEVDPSCAHLRLVTEPNNGLDVRTTLSNSFGFGGTNASLVLRRWE